MDNYDIFSDRVNSLIERWDKFHSNNPAQWQFCIRGFLQEVTDTFTTSLIDNPISVVESVPINAAYVNGSYDDWKECMDNLRKNFRNSMYMFNYDNGYSELWLLHDEGYQIIWDNYSDNSDTQRIRPYKDVPNTIWQSDIKITIIEVL